MTRNPMMTTPTLQSILALNDEDFLRWVAEMEQPKPWKHKQTPVLSAFAAGKIRLSPCLKCGRNDQEPCTIPDPLTRSLAEIVSEKVKGIAADEGAFGRACCMVMEAVGAKGGMWRWFTLAGPKLQYVCLWLAGQEGKGR